MDLNLNSHRERHEFLIHRTSKLNVIASKIALSLFFLVSKQILQEGPIAMEVFLCFEKGWYLFLTFMCHDAATTRIRRSCDGKTST